MKGNLKTIPLTTLVQMFGQSGLTGRLDLKKENLKAELFFKDGNIVDAKLGEKSGRPVFYSIIGWVDADFSLDTNDETNTYTISESWSDLLLEGLLKLDESTKKTIKERETKVIPDDIGKLFGFDKNIEENKGISPEATMANQMEEVLKELGQEIPGLITATIVGMDGLGVAHFTNSAGDPDAVNAQATILLKLVTSTLEKVMNEKVEDLLMTNKSTYLMLKQLDDPEYFLGILCYRDQANLGNMRLMSRTIVKRLSNVMPK